MVFDGLLPLMLDTPGARRYIFAVPAVALLRHLRRLYQPVVMLIHHANAFIYQLFLQKCLKYTFFGIISA